MGMVRTVGAVAATGVASVLLFKLIAGIALPLLGMAFGLLMSVLKIGLIVAAAVFIYRMIQRRRNGAEV